MLNILQIDSVGPSEVSASVSTTTDRMSDGITSTNEISNIRWHCISCFAKPPCTPSVSANFSFLRYDKSDSAKSEPQNASQSRYKPNRLSLRSVKFDIPFSSRLDLPIPLFRKYPDACLHFTYTVGIC